MLPDFTSYSISFGPTVVTDSVVRLPSAGPRKWMVTGSVTAISQLPSVQAPTSVPSAAAAEGEAGAGVGRDGVGRSRGVRGGSSSASWVLPHAAVVRAVSAARALRAGCGRECVRYLVVRQGSVRGKETSTLRFFLRPASVELSAMGYCSP
ncbi:hypothetical protein GCM10010095_64010 [Streptomyces anthocyanicus]|nr:hypothetical protein GCM10010095_64010 [Streptomyces anthocyanicus]